MPDLTIPSWLTSLLAAVWSIANTSFFTSVMGAGFGAWFGARAAQRIAARAKRKEELRDEGAHPFAPIESAIGPIRQSSGS